MSRIARWSVLAGSILLLPPAAMAADGNAEAGAKVFNKCAVCHSVKDTTRKVGPTLNGVVGRTAGTLEGFRYSTAMVEAGEGGLVWTEADLAEYVAAPKIKVPGNAMAFAGLKNPQDIADVIAYIKTFSPAAQ